MRALLWAGLALALVLAAALWWLVGAPATRPEVPQPPSGASTMGAAAEPVLAEPTVSAEPYAASDAARADRASATSREALDAAARPIRGRLIDAHCDRPIGSGVRLQLRSRIRGVAETVAPAADGSFTTTAAFSPGRVAVRILEARSGEELLEHALVFDPREPVWTVRAEIGLVIPFELAIPDGIPRDRVMAHVVEDGPDGPRNWFSMPVRGGEHAFLHYRVLRQRVGAVSARLTVDVDPERGPGAHGQVPLSTTHGVHAPVRIVLLEETHAFGRVVDTRGDGVVGARVSLLPTASETPLTAGALGRRSVLTGKAGAFALEELEPGPQVLQVSSGMRATVSRRLVLQQGANDLGSTVLASVEGWTVQGRIVNWSSGNDWFLSVALVEPESGRRWYTRTTPYDEESGRAFEFHDVPPGTYEVRPVVYYDGGVRFEPPSAIVSPSSPEVEFRWIESTVGKLVLRALDGSSSVPIERFAVACRSETGWVGGVMSQGESLPFEAPRYVVWGEGHRARVVDSAAFAGEGDLRVADVVLQRGWSELLVFVDPEDPSATVDGQPVPHMAAPLSGVRVLAQGREVAKSDADGLAVVSLAEDPGDLAFELEGRHVLATERDDGLQFVWMIRTE